MIDTRVNWVHQIYQKEEDLLAADQCHQIWSKNEIVTRWIRAWWKSFIKDNRAYKYPAELKYSFPAQLKKIETQLESPSKELESFFGSVKSWVKRDDTASPKVGGIGKTFARILAPDFVKTKSHFEIAFQFFSEHGEALNFEKHLKEEIQKLPKTKVDSWIKYFTVSKDLPFSLVQMYRDQKSQLQGLIDQEIHGRDSAATFNAIWRSLNQGHLSGNWLAMSKLKMLCSLDFIKFFGLFERIPTTEVKGMVFRELQIENQPDVIISWIKQSPPALDKDGNVVSSVLLFGVDAIVEYARNLHASVARLADTELFGPVNRDLIARAGAEKPKIEAGELPNWFQSNIASLLKRKDGMTILLDFAMELIHRILHMLKNQIKNGWHPEQAAVDAIAGYLSNNPTLVKQARARAEWYEERNTSRRVSPSSLMLLAALAQGKQLEKAVAIWDWYVDLLKRGDQSIVSHINRYSPADSWVFEEIGGLLDVMNGSTQSIVDIWRDLFQQRFVSRFRSIQSEDIDPSRHLLRVTLGALNNQLVKQERNKSFEKDLWTLASKMARDLYLSYGDLSYVNDYDDVERVFCYVKHVFDGQVAEAIQEWNEIFEAEPEVCLVTINSCLVNEMPPKLINDAFKNIDIDLNQKITEMEQWIEVAGEKGSRKVDPAYLREKLGIPPAALSQ